MNNKQKDNLEIKRHSTSHILAAAVLKFFPEAKFAIGPDIENGFYYDFELPRTLIPEDLPLLEAEMKKIIKANHSFEKRLVPAQEALDKFKKLKQSYKVELIEDLIKEGETEVILYKSGDFVDLCSGPHLQSAGEIDAQAFKLTHISGAYWKGDEKRESLQRIYGTVFQNKKDLKKHLFELEEAKKRDHKKIGKELDLFSFHSSCPGMVHWHEKGMFTWNELEKFGKEIKKEHGFIEIKTPQMAKNDLWIKSGHWDHYKDDMFVFKAEDETYCLKPMDCPFNINIFENTPKSYKDLPVRYTEIGRVFRNEKSGQLNGLFRVREITQDDSHIFFSEEQTEQEIDNLLNIVKIYYKGLGIEPRYFLSTRPKDFMGDKETWDKAEKNLKEVLESRNLKYEIKEGDGAFYGPKIDVDIKDSLGREWQVATIQLDFQLPGRFDCYYIDREGNKKTPILLHAAIFGSFERMIGILIEHYAGKFPTWLAPVQIALLPVSDKFEKYSQKIENDLKEKGFRIEIPNPESSLGKRIAESTKQKIPYLLILGEKEENEGTITIRKRDEKEQQTIKIEEFMKMIEEEIKLKK
jgi:threonyl-tRNA synthetase